MDELRFDPFDPPDLADWLVRNSSEYIQERVSAGDTPEEASANAEASLGRAFPNGSPAPGQLAGRLVWGGQPIGELWVGRFGSDPQRGGCGMYTSMSRFGAVDWDARRCFWPKSSLGPTAPSRLV